MQLQDELGGVFWRNSVTLVLTQGCMVLIWNVLQRNVLQSFLERFTNVL